MVLAAWALYWLRLRQVRSRFAMVLDERARISREPHRGYVFQFFLAGVCGVVRTRGRETPVRRGDLLAIDVELNPGHDAP